MKQLENGFSDNAVIKSSAENSSQFSVQSKYSTLEFFVILQKSLVDRVHAIIGSVGEDSVEIFELFVDLVDSAGESFATNATNLHLLKLEELLSSVEEFFDSLKTVKKTVIPLED